MQNRDWKSDALLVPDLVLAETLLTWSWIRISAFSLIPLEITLLLPGMLVISIMSLCEGIVGAEVQVLAFDLSRLRIISAPGD